MGTPGWGSPWSSLDSPGGQGDADLSNEQGGKGPGALAILRSGREQSHTAGRLLGPGPLSRDLPPLPAVALPPEKTDGLASGDEKRMEKSSESCPGSKKQLKFEVSFPAAAPRGHGSRAGRAVWARTCV